MIYDCFLYAGEEDVLRVRLEELADVPNLVHVALQETYDLRGRPRDVDWPSGLGDKRNKLWCGVTTCRPAGRSPKELEHWLRRSLPLHADAAGCTPDDLVIVADVDEIPSERQLLEAASEAPYGPVALLCDYRELKVDWRAPDAHQPPHQAFMAASRMIFDAQQMREATPHYSKKYAGGWHLSSMGGVGAVALKLRTFSHDELDPQFQDLAWLEWCAENGRDLLDRFDLEPVPREPGLLPSCVLADPVRWAHLLRENV